ncbi:MAG TPA: AAA family ATPase, partial [Gemmatimonadales bacterium]|nr:AAA family ATPase [Gemmatimonadales bacterium]
MIVELRVRDLATIADVALQCGPGLNVLTGETGAGKSMLIDALSLLLGERGDSALVRPGAARCVVEGAFETDRSFRRRLDALGLDAEDERVVIRREVSAEGRSRAWVNGSPTTLTILAELGAALVDLHGQHETQSLLRPDAQRDILDAYAGAGAARAGVESAWREVQALREREAGLARQRDE